MVKQLVVSIFLATLVLLVFEISRGGPGIFWTYIKANFDSQAQGEITRSKKRPGTLRSPSRYDIRYEYEVSGTFYNSRIVSAFDFAYEVDANLKRYPVGERVVVYFDSKSPEYAVLEKRPLSVGIVFQVLAVISIVAIPLTYNLFKRFFRVCK